MAGVIVFLLLVILILKSIIRPSVDTDEGEAYIAMMEQRDPAEVLQKINAAQESVAAVANPDSDTYTGDNPAAEQEVPQQAEITSDQRESLYAEQAAGLYSQIDSLEIAPLSPEQLAWYQQRLDNTVVVGDSLAQAVYDNGFLDGNHVYFKRGASISQLDQELAEAAAMLPSNIIFYTGLNDTDIFPDVNDFAAAYMQKVQEAESLCPGARIYICSMCPPSDALGAVREDLARAPEYDAMMRYVCDNSSATYIDLKWMVRQSLYHEDGIHFNYYFYTIWLQYIDMNLQ